jgi:hypothetical protein
MTGDILLPLLHRNQFHEHAFTAGTPLSRLSCVIHTTGGVCKDHRRAPSLARRLMIASFFQELQFRLQDRQQFSIIRQNVPLYQQSTSYSSYPSLQSAERR